MKLSAAPAPAGDSGAGDRALAAAARRFFRALERVARRGDGERPRAFFFFAFAGVVFFFVFFLALLRGGDEALWVGLAPREYRAAARSAAPRV